MIELIWDESFTRTLKKWRKKHPELVDRFQRKLELFKFLSDTKVVLIDLGTHDDVY